MTAFIGRKAELRQVRTYLAGSRMVTLVGGGGCGKSRLALEVAHGAAHRYRDGAHLVELAPVVEPKLVLGALAGALEIPQQPGRDLMATVCDHTREREMLLVLDNCEHVVGEVARICGAILAASPRLVVLATSRVAVSVPAERTWTVPGLNARDSLLLLQRRGAEASRGFSVDATNESTAVEICRRLDGIPLAIEFAAARLKTLSVQQLAERLTDRFRLLTGSNRGSVPRQRTLQATMDWSYDLLSSDARYLWRRMSVFHGGATLESVEAVCSDHELDQRVILDCLTTLVDNSIVYTRDVGSDRRFDMLETVREYGRLRLAAPGESQTIRRRHLEWIQSLASRAEAEWRGRNQRAWLAKLDLEIDNVRAALDFAATESTDHNDDGLRIASALWLLWHSRHIGEGRQWLANLLSRARDGTPRAYAMNVAGFLAYVQGDAAAALPLLEESLRLHEMLGDRPGANFALLRLGIGLYYNNDLDEAIAVLDQALTRYRAAHDRVGTYVSAYELAEVCAMHGDHDRARDLLRESHGLKLEQGDTWHLALSHFGTGLLAWREGDLPAAASAVRQCLNLYRDLDDSWGLAKAVELLGWIESSRENDSRAIRLLAAATAMHERLSARLSPNYEVHHVRCVDLLRKRSTAAAFESEWARGRAMTADTTVELAIDQRPTSSRKLERIEVITAREREIAELVSTGMTNREIASKLSLAERTVDSHVEHIMNKLGHHSRAQIAAWVGRRSAIA